MKQMATLSRLCFILSSFGKPGSEVGLHLGNGECGAAMLHWVIFHELSGPGGERWMPLPRY
jgi:hypothetical protein